MELKVELDENEIAEVAKMAYIARFVMGNSGRFSKNYKYPRMEIFTSALRQLNEAIADLIPERGLLEVDKNSVYMHTIKMEDEMAPVLTQFTHDEFLESICVAISRREYAEEYGIEEDYTILENGSLYDTIYQNNWRELQKNGLKNFGFNAKQ
jgi:hypothetical protein